MIIGRGFKNGSQEKKQELRVYREYLVQFEDIYLRNIIINVKYVDGEK